MCLVLTNYIMNWKVVLTYFVGKYNSQNLSFVTMLFQKDNYHIRYIIASPSDWHLGTDVEILKVNLNLFSCYFPVDTEVSI